MEPDGQTPPGKAAPGGVLLAGGVQRCVLWGEKRLGMSPWYKTGVGSSCTWWCLSHPQNLPHGAGSCQSHCHTPACERRSCCLCCPSMGISSCLSPGRCRSWWGGLTGALTGPALGRAHLVQTQQRLSCPCGISSLQQHQWLCR